MNDITTKAQTTTEATSTEITAKAPEISAEKKYLISGTIEAAEKKLADAKAALEAAERELDLAKINSEFEKLMDWLLHANPTTFIDVVRYAVNNCNYFPDYVPYYCPNADDAYCGVIVKAARKAGKEIEGDLLLNILRKKEISSYEIDLCVKAWEDIKNS